MALPELDVRSESSLRWLVDLFVRVVETAGAVIIVLGVLGKLAVVAAIRTALNYFLAREIAEERRNLDARAAEGPALDRQG